MAKTLSTQAAAAKEIRNQLKAAFPHTTFKVKSRGFSGGNAVDIDWTDGPTCNQVEQIVAKHEYGKFDGMRDIYEYTNVRNDIAQAKYVHTQRSFSRETYRAAVDWLNRHYGWSLVVDDSATYNTIASGDMFDPQFGRAYRSHEINPVMHKKSLVCHECRHTTAFADAFCGNCGAALTTCETCHGYGLDWDDDLRMQFGSGWTEDPCPVCNGSGFAPLPTRSAA